MMEDADRIHDEFFNEPEPPHPADVAKARRA
jgi:hypothetical protein